jgi:hypothetical protein
MVAVVSCRSVPATMLDHIRKADVSQANPRRGTKRSWIGKQTKG